MSKTGNELHAQALEDYRKKHGVIIGQYNEETATFGLNIYDTEMDTIREVANTNGIEPERLIRLLFKTQIESLRYAPHSDDYWKDFVDGAMALVPESYDGDESPESILLRYLEDMDKFHGLMARVTSSYR